MCNKIDEFIDTQTEEHALEGELVHAQEKNVNVDRMLSNLKCEYDEVVKSIDAGCKEGKNKKKYGKKDPSLECLDLQKFAYFLSSYP